MSKKYWSKKMRIDILKAIFYILIIAVILPLITRLFLEYPIFEEYRNYLPYIQSAIIFGIGYMAVSSISNIVYDSMRKTIDHSTASIIRTIIKIIGIAILVSLMVSIFNVNPSSALTVGSFSGLVIGFATQSVLTHAVAGIFIAISRPFKHGDLVTVTGQTGIIKEIKIMHTKLESIDKEKEILIPSGKIIGEVIVITNRVQKKEE